MRDPTPAFFVQFGHVKMTESESADCKEALLQFIAQNPVRIDAKTRLTGMHPATPFAGLGMQAMSLSPEEQDDMTADLRAFMRQNPVTPRPAARDAHVPLFFGTWSPSNLLRLVKPFFLSEETRAAC